MTLIRKCTCVVFIIGMEIVGGPWKTYIGIGLELPWSLGYSILPGIAFLLKVSVAETILHLLSLTVQQ